MNDIDELGGAVGANLPIQYKDLLNRCDPNDLPEELPEVKDHPIFRGITLSTEAPEQDVTNFEKRLEDALQSRLWQLADETIGAILQTRSDAPLKALLETIQAADAMKLAEHITPRWPIWCARSSNRRSWSPWMCGFPITMAPPSSAKIRRSWRM